MFTFSLIPTKSWGTEDRQPFLPGPVSYLLIFLLALLRAEGPRANIHWVLIVNGEIVFTKRLTCARGRVSTFMNAEHSFIVANKGDETGIHKAIYSTRPTRLAQN
jgi:hypothetical protein